MRKRLVVANWKMNFTSAQAAAAVEGFVRLVDLKADADVDVVICPPFLSLPKVSELLRNTSIRVGAQTVFWMEYGAYTGQVSPTMLNEFRVAYALVGHSETRGRFGKLEVPVSTLGYFAESDETVNLKVRALLFHAIHPILCVGETAEERDRGETEVVVRRQLTGGLAGLDVSEIGEFCIAYEPVWAIGTGNTCDAAEANRMAEMIRSLFADQFGTEAGESLRVLYGGSVRSSNSAELFSQPHIDGGLVGGASLDPQEFSRIVVSS